MSQFIYSNIYLKKAVAYHWLKFRKQRKIKHQKHFDKCFYRNFHEFAVSISQKIKKRKIRASF